MSAAGSGSASGGEPAVEVVLGLDAGTTSAKAIAVDRAGRILATAGSAPIATRSTPAGASEQDPAEIWQALATAGRRAVEILGPASRVAALAMAAQSGSVIPVPAGNPAERAITWMDTRSRAVVEGWPPEVADRIRALSGWTPAPGAGLATIAWLLAEGSGPHAKGGPARVYRWASVDDYLMFRLTGRWATNPSNASGMQLMNVSTCTWSPELCRVASADPVPLSPMLESGTVAGSLTGEAAAALGLDPGTPVVVGGHDQACAALGLGAVQPGDLFLSAGTAWVLTLVTDRADVAALPPSLNLSPHVVAGRWTASTNLGGLGALIAQSPPDRTAAVFETCARKVGEALEGAGEMAGGAAMVVVGGGTRFDELIEMIAGAADRPVVVRPDASWPAVGAARLAAAALGWAPPEAERTGGDRWNLSEDSHRFVLAPGRGSVTRPAVAITIGQAHYGRMFSAAALADLAAAAEIVHHPGGEPASKHELMAVLAESDACITGWGVAQLDADVVAAAPRLGHMAHMGGSVKRFVSDAVWARGIRVTSAAVTLARDVAETTLGLMIVGRKRIWPLGNHVRDGGWRDSAVWDRWDARELHRSTVGLVGAGNVGRHVIELLAPFSVTVLVADPYLDHDEAESLGVEQVGLAELMERSDVVSIHAPETDQTRHMIGAEELSRLGDGAVLINTARGGIIDEAALIDELATGRIFAFLDVTDPEPPAPDSPLRHLENAVVTPHIAGCIDNCHRMGELAVEEVRRYLAGRPAVNEIRPEMLDRIA